MTAKENGTRNVTQQKHPSPLPTQEKMSAEEKTAQYALAQDCMNYEWANNPRWKGIERPYSAEDVLRLRGSVHIEHTLARLGAERLPTFTVGLPYKQFDEAPHARNVATRYNTQHHELTVQPSLKRILPDLVWHLDEPSDPLSLCAYHVAQFARKTVKVVIGGDGGGLWRARAISTARNC